MPSVTTQNIAQIASQAVQPSTVAPRVEAPASSIQIMTATQAGAQKATVMPKASDKERPVQVPKVTEPPYSPQSIRNKRASKDLPQQDRQAKDEGAGLDVLV
jgi:hypothetical protein